jgi:hypothetical protein
MGQQVSYPNIGTGSLIILASGLDINNAANTENMLTAYEDGAVTLYHNNAAKLATTATGIDVTGTVVAGGITTTGNTSAAVASAGDGRLFPNNSYGAFVYGNGTIYDVALGQRSTGVALGVLAGTTNVVIPTGIVGIGTSSPALTLALSGGTGSAPATSGTTQNGTFRIRTAANGVIDMGSVSATGAGWLQATDQTNLASSYNLLLNPNGGNVGIGTSSPAANAKLHVAKSADGGVAEIILENSFTNAGSSTDEITQIQGRFGGYDASYILTGKEGDFTTAALRKSYLAFSTRTATTGMTEKVRIDSTGAVTMPYQPAFLVIPTGGQSNFPINAQTTVDFANEIFDQGNNFSSNTFTAPVSGRYQFSVMLYGKEMDTATDYYQCILATSNRTYPQIVSSNRYTADLTYYSFAVSILADMDAGDTAYVKIDVPNSGTAQLDLESTASRFSGYLVA